MSERSARMNRRLIKKKKNNQQQPIKNTNNNLNTLSFFPFLPHPPLCSHFAVCCAYVALETKKLFQFVFSFYVIHDKT